MKHIDLNTQEEAIQRFFRSFPVDPEGAVLELNGQALARVLPVTPAANGGPDVTEVWTEAKNRRRCALIDKEIDGTLTPEEVCELESLQRQMLRQRRQAAPLPLDDWHRQCQTRR